MASTASNATSTWPTRLCICGAGPCIPRKSGSRAKHPGKWYYDCPGDPPCREWNGWCNESIPNIAHSQDDSMSSPGGGRGKGNWSTRRKAILQPSEERNFSQVSPRRQFSQSYEQPHYSRYYDQPNFDQAAQEANFSQHTHTSMLSPSVGRGRGMRASPHKTFSHASRQPNFSSQDQQFWQPSPQIYQPTSSPSRGRGRGIGTSPRKAFSQPAEHAYGMQHSQQPYFSQPAQNPCTNTIDRAKWTSLSVKSLLEACAEEIDENGRAVNGFSKQAWARILNAVMGKTGRKFTKKQLKDKHDRLKEEWKAWILVAEDKRQTGLGRNPETGAITGPDHWWTAMIADCIGAMDGTHVLCNPPPKDAHKYFGRKGGHTMNIIAICDFDLRFTFASAGWEGSMHDYNVFRECVYGRGRHMFPHPPDGKYYLVDSGYPNSDGYLAPYKGYTYHLEDFRRSRKRNLDAHEYFNRWHSSLRSAIERTFGVWKSRWRMMKETSTYPVRIHKLFVIASMAIHNYIRRNSENDDEFAEAFSKDERYVFQDLPDINPEYAAREDDQGFIYTQAANTLDMERVRRGIMTALHNDRGTIDQPQRRRRN